MSAITQLIERANEGDRQAAERLFAALYEEIHRLARYQLGRANGAMQATSLVHEAYCKLAQGAKLAINDREHFYATAARVMRQIVLDSVRARAAEKRGGEFNIVAMDTQIARGLSTELPDEEVLALDEALAALEITDPALAKLVELKFFAGLELKEISALIDRSESSLKRDWRRARAILHAAMASDPDRAFIPANVKPQEPEP
ncbi:MAG: ECF-type sigma factor [Wenzhouxiangella sp.]